MDTRNIQSDLTQIQPVWSEILPADVRFVSALNGAAVLDLETGLVWKKSTDPIGVHLWPFAQDACDGKVVGGRSGWRLPTIQELESLVDPTQSNPALPVGHPFSNVADVYWSATSRFEFDKDLERAWAISFKDGLPRTVDKDQEGLFDAKAIWCVRGGQGVDTQ